MGKASEAEVYEARARRSHKTKMSAVQADNNYQLALLELSQLLELPTPDGFGVVSPRVEDDFTLLSLPEDIYAQAVLNKPSIKAALFRLEGAAKNIRIAQSSWYPQLNFSAGIGTNYYNISGVENASFSSQCIKILINTCNFSLSIPLFNRFDTRNKVKNARIQRTAFIMEVGRKQKRLFSKKYSKHTIMQ